MAITDDHPLVVQGLCDMLSDVSDVEVVASYTDARTTEDELEQAAIDVLLLDINLPDKDGTELCSSLLAKLPDLGILALTSYDEVSMVRTMMRHGAKGYLQKNVDKQELLLAIRTVHSGGEYIQSAMRQRIMNSALGRPTNVSSTPRLTRREKEVLSLIIAEHTSAAIAQALHLSPKTVESHRAVLFQKFGVRNVAGLVKQALEHGLG